MSIDTTHDSFWHVIEHLPIGIFLSRAGRVVYANPTFARYLGHTSTDTLVGLGPDEILAPEDRESGLANVVAAGAPFRSVPRRDWRVRRRDGTFLTVETEATQQVIFAGERAVLWTVIDVTELRSMQAKRLQSDRLASIGRLAAGVGHEINNPLTYVLSALELLQTKLPGLAAARTVDPSQLAPLVRDVEEAIHGADRVRAIVRDLKTFSRVEQDVVRIDLHAVLESTLQIAMSEIRPRARLVRSFAVCPAVLASEAAIGQVFLNLLLNAAQAIPEGDPGLHQIYVSTTTSAAGEAVIEISDTGCGIPPELQDRVFDPFVTTKPVATGLGLAICRNTVRSLGGTISLESEPRLGTTVRLVLPAAPPLQRAEPVTSAAPFATRATQSSTSRSRLLVVDDEPAIVATIVRILSPTHDVVGVTDARDACRRIESGERFDLVITDLIMPEMTGMELHAAVAAIDAAQARRTLLLTGGAFTTAAASFLDQVALPRMAKPFNSLELIDQVSDLLREHRQAT